MTRDEAVSMIKRQLGFRSNQDANIVTCLKLAQTQLELQPIKPWFLVSEDSYKRTTTDEERLVLPTDFLEEVEDAVFKYVPDDATTLASEIDLVKDDYDVLRKNFHDTEAGAPQAYCLMGQYFRIFPVPDASYMIRMIYYKKDTVLDSNVENGWLKNVPMLLMGKAGQIISEGPLRDTQATAVFKSWEVQGTLALNGRNVSRDMANRRLQMGGPV